MQEIGYNKTTRTEGGAARTDARSDHAVLDFSLVTFFVSRQRK